MGISINTNVGALSASAATGAINKSMEISMERLSTGKRINTAADDAAGVAIASRLTAEIRGTNQAIRNAMDGQALIDTAEGAHKEIEFILQRMRELAVQSANDTNNEDDRVNLQAEMDALVEEIDRISQSSTWAGQKLLTGVGGNNGDGTFVLQVGSRTAAEDRITATIAAMDADTLGVSTTRAADVVNLVVLDDEGEVSEASEAELVAADLETIFDAEGDPEFAAAGEGDPIVGKMITVTVAEGVEDSVFSFRVNGIDVEYTQGEGGFAEDENGVAQGLAQAIRDANISGVSVVVDDNEIAIYTGSSGLITSAEASRAMILAIDEAILTVNTQRSELGAISNRLDSTVRNLTNVATNLEAGRGRIEDADFAIETTNLATSQILQQAAMAMLAQANASKQGVLSLLQR